MNNAILIIFGLMFCFVGFLLGAFYGLPIALGSYLLFVIIVKLDKIIKLLERIENSNKT